MYSLLLALALPLASPLLLFVPKTRAGIKQKLGLIDKSLRKALASYKKAIWIHAVSVGEFNGVFPLVQAVKDKYPDTPLVISTTTKAGQLLAKQRAGHMAQVIYFPLDLTWSVNRLLSLIEPSLVIIFETELWPNFIDSCWLRNIPVAILNARMSPRSFKRYKLTKWLFGPLLKKLSLIGAQSEKEVEHYKAIAGDDLPIQVFGNLKYDWPALMDIKAIADLKNRLGIKSDDLVLIAGSTHPQEEKIILDTYKQFLSSLSNQHKNLHKNLKIIIAPRHPERFETVAKIIENAGCNVRRYSKNEKFVEQNDIYLLDTIGQLANFYSIASLAFVGGSIAKVGGHNLLEPYLYAVPVVCGPHLFKTKEAANILDNEKALFIAPDSQTVQNKLLELVQDSDLRKKMGITGQSWLNNNRGAVLRSLAAIEILLQKNKSDSNQIEHTVEMISL